jgi:hypothetical protein
MRRYRPAKTTLIASLIAALAGTGVSIAETSQDEAANSRTIAGSRLKSRTLSTRHFRTGAVNHRIIKQNTIGQQDVKDFTLLDKDIGTDQVGGRAANEDTFDPVPFARRLTSQVRIPRTTVSLTSGFVSFGTSAECTAGNPASDGESAYPSSTACGGEGGNTKQLTSIGKGKTIIIEGLCRKNAPTEDEAKVMAYSNTGTLSFQGENGARKNVPAGRSPTENSSTGARGLDRRNGEGQHQLLAVSRDPRGSINSTSSDEDLVTGTGQGADLAAAFKATRSNLVVTSDGLEVVVDIYAGIDALGVGDKCVFGGMVQFLG